MSGFVIRVCQKHYFLLVSRGKVNDFLPCFEGKCLLGSCSEPAFRRVLVGEVGQSKKVIFDGVSLCEEVIPTFPGGS